MSRYTLKVLPVGTPVPHNYISTTEVHNRLGTRDYDRVRKLAESGHIDAICIGSNTDGRYGRYYVDPNQMDHLTKKDIELLRNRLLLVKNHDPITAEVLKESSKRFSGIRAPRTKKIEPMPEVKLTPITSMADKIDAQVEQIKADAVATVESQPSPPSLRLLASLDNMVALQQETLKAIQSLEKHWS